MRAARCRAHQPHHGGAVPRHRHGAGRPGSGAAVAGHPEGHPPPRLLGDTAGVSATPRGRRTGTTGGGRCWPVAPTWSTGSPGRCDRSDVGGPTTSTTRPRGSGWRSSMPRPRDPTGRWRSWPPRRTTGERSRHRASPWSTRSSPCRGRRAGGCGAGSAPRVSSAASTPWPTTAAGTIHWCETGCRRRHALRSLG